MVGSIGSYSADLGIPVSYTINYPDGRIVTFSGNGGTYLGPVGVTDRFQGVAGSGYCYLLLSDGGRVRFSQTGTYDHVAEKWTNISLRTVDQIIDPNGQVTNLTYGAYGVSQVTEPAGRWLKIYYNSGDSTISRVDAGYTTVTQSVVYGYTSKLFSGAHYNNLTSATYSDGTASYTYQASNAAPAGVPLIKTCADLRYPGPMQNITYLFAGVRGQLSQEKNTTSGALVVSLAITSTASRTETRGDGPSRRWTYGTTAGGHTYPYLLKSTSDFISSSNLTTRAYDSYGFVNRSPI